MAPGKSSHHRTSESRDSQEKPEEVVDRWYLSRKEIEDNSPSRRDGIDLKKETCLRKSYCTFLQDLGKRLKLPQVTIATAIIFCHRFFIRQSHAKNDRRTIATACMFVAGKVEETPRPLNDIIMVSYEIIHKEDSAAPQRIRQQKEVFEQRKELILLGERVLLATLGFDLNVHHPYKPLVEAIKKFKVAQNALAEVAWCFVNDGLKTSLCLQFKPHHIAVGAVFLATKFLKVKLPSDGVKFRWQEFDITPRELEEVSNQMLEIYEQRSFDVDAGEWRDGGASRKCSSIAGRNLNIRKRPVGHSLKEALKMIDKDKVKAALEKRRKSRGETTRRKDLMDEDDLIERELEDGVEWALHNERIKRQRRQCWSIPHENSDHGEIGDGNHLSTKGQSLRGSEAENAEEGEIVDVVERLI